MVIFKYCSDFYRLWFTLFQTFFKTQIHSFPDWLNLVQILKLVQVHSFQNKVYSSPDTCLFFPDSALLFSHGLVHPFPALVSPLYKLWFTLFWTQVHSLPNSGSLSLFPDSGRRAKRSPQKPCRSRNRKLYVMLMIV